jgi:hypothetical protein
MLAAGALAAPASADGDPASDVLYMQDVFVPYAKPSRQAVVRLDAAVVRANAAGYRIKVAVIQSRIDMGTATALFAKPQLYAGFLGAEIRFFFHGHLLVVMPSGFGVFYGGRSTALPQRLLAALAHGGYDPSALAESAAKAVELLAAKDTSKPRYRDIYPPSAQPLPFVVKNGNEVKFEYSVYDDSLRASASVEVRGKGNSVLLQRARPMGPAKGAIETIRWTPPDSYRRRSVQLCVSARDPAGNASPPACVPVRLP